MRLRKHPWLAADTWFRPVSARSVTALRVGLPLLLLLHLFWISGDVLSLHGSRGIIPWELMDLLRDSWVPGLPTLARIFSPFGLEEHAAIVLLLAIYAGSLVSLALGFLPRLSALLAWGLNVSLMTSGFASYYGVDQIAKTFLFYLVLFPSGRTPTVPVACLRVMQLHLSVIYLAAGIDKARGRQWWNGEAIWQALSQPIFSTFDLSWLASHSWIPVLVGWGTLVVEIGYGLFIWHRRTRRAWCLATIGLHLGLGLFMGLVFFSSVMILLNACFFLIPEQIEERVPAPRRRQVLAATAALAMAFLPIAREARAEPPLSDEFSTLVRRVLVRDQIPGAVIGVVDRGRLVVVRTFGYRDLERRLPVTPDTLFLLGSCSKAFTATAVAMLADDGRIALDVPVRHYLPDFALEDPAASASLTTRDLLTHKSGLPRHDLFWYDAPFSRDELYGRLRFLEPVGPSRAAWRYNSLMYVVAGRVVEKVSGQSWESFVTERMLSPLQMWRTVVSIEAMEADADHATPYALRDGRLRRLPMPKHLSAVAPAGGVQTSARDLARWLAFHTTRSPPLLGESMWRELHRPQAAMPPADVSEVRGPHYALGWIHESYRGHPLVAHNGAIDGFTVHLGFLPENGKGLFVLMNRDLASAGLMTIAYAAYDRLLGLDPLDWESRFEETRAPREDVPEVALDLRVATMVGSYEHPAYGLIAVRATGSDLEMEFRTLRWTLAYQGNRRFLSRKPIVDGGPHIAVRFSNQTPTEAMKLVATLNFDEGDPVQVFTRVE